LVVLGRDLPVSRLPTRLVRVLLVIVIDPEDWDVGFWALPNAGYGFISAVYTNLLG
jgi:hypothetical protein